MEGALNYGPSKWVSWNLGKGLLIEASITVVDYYAERAGIRIDNFDYYYAYGLFRLAAIVQQIYYRYFNGQTQDKRFAQCVQMNALLEQVSLQVINESKL